MTPAQQELLKLSLATQLGWQPDRVIWSGAPRPVFVGNGDASRVGFLELSLLSLVGNGASDSSRTVWEGTPPTRTVTIHKARIATVQFDAFSLQANVEAFNIIERVYSVLQEVATEAEHEAAQISICEVGRTNANAPFSADKGFFSRAIGEVSFNVTWEETDRSAPAESIGSASATLEPIEEET